MAMLTIYCGDNTIQSRRAFVDHKRRLVQEEHECIEIQPSEVRMLDQIIYGSASLFSTKQAYFLEGILNKATHRKALKDYYNDPKINLIIWEGSIDQRDIKRYFPKAQIYASSLPTNLWKFLDALAPGNVSLLIQSKNNLSLTIEDSMLLYMMQRRMKELILAFSGVDGKRPLAAWQKQNLVGQARRWGHTDQERSQKLHRMYQKLYDIEVNTKTSSMTYSVNQALDIVFSFYLQ